VFANGQYILIRRAVYQAVGGHAVVAGKVLEDVELARAVVGAGHRLQLALGRDLFTTRMYNSLRELVRGWTKNFYMILHSRVYKVLLAAAVSLLFSVWPAVAGGCAAVALLTGWRPWPSGWLWAVLGVYVLVLVFQVTLRAINRWYPAYALLAPLANLVVVAILLRSALKHLRGQGVVWKGREVFDDQKGKP
jgi:hypothetical protein